MAATTTDQDKRSILQKFKETGFVYITGWIVLIWVLEVSDTVLLGDRLQRQGIKPRSVDGLDGVLWAPFLHDGFGHLISNTFPFIVLGALVAIRGRSHWLLVTASSIAVGGILTWIFARSGNHIGSSGVVFGYLGALIGAAVFERKLAYIAPAVIAIFFYGSIFVGLVPQNRVSWEGHLAGLVAGAAATYVLSKRRKAKTLEPTTGTGADGLTLPNGLSELDDWQL